MINVVLYEPEIPQNTGNIMRTCAAFKMNLHLIEPLGFSLDEKHLKRSGMDYIEKMQYKTYTNWEEFLNQQNPKNIFYISRYANKSPDEFKFSEIPEDEDIYIVFGKESTGIPKEILHNNFDKCMRIPMEPDSRSLNLSNCVAIISYEVLKQLGYPKLVKHEVIKGEHFLDQF